MLLSLSLTRRGRRVPKLGSVTPKPLTFQPSNPLTLQPSNPPILLLSPNSAHHAISKPKLKLFWGPSPRTRLYTPRPRPAFPPLCATVGLADGEVTSQNVVGYNTLVNTDNPSIIFGVQFKNVASDAVIPFDKLGCTSAFEDGDMIEVSYTDENGVTQLRDYFYYTEDTMGEAGWYDENPVHVGGTEGLLNGQGAWFCSSGSPKEITCSGEVGKTNPTHTFTDFSTLTSSAFPTQFCPNSANVTWTGLYDGDMIEVSYTDSNGVTQLRDYFYYTADTMGVEGWYDEQPELLDANAAIVAPGAGFWLCLGTDTEGTFTEVSPIAD